MGLVDLARAVNDLTVRARDKKLTHADVTGGTFTLNNVGAIGGFASMSIINHPQAAILTTQTIVRRPVGRNEEIVLRDMMNLTMTFDHRIIDGIASSKFMSDVQGALESWTPDVIRH
jgi:2-oxoisovalerate dehydrogenase E2 component (dihydrolipoyl transacylase)